MVTVSVKLNIALYKKKYFLNEFSFLIQTFVSQIQWNSVFSFVILFRIQHEIYKDIH